jgi:hypothetical protein
MGINRYRRHRRCWGGTPLCLRVVRGDKSGRKIKNLSDNFTAAKAAGIYVMPAAIIALFYAYTTITGSDNLIADITIFVVAIALGQLTSYKMLTLPSLSRRLYILAIIGLVALGVLFTLFTFHPPQVPMFRDPVSGAYGIP